MPILTASQYKGCRRITNYSVFITSSWLMTRLDITKCYFYITLLNLQCKETLNCESDSDDILEFKTSSLRWTKRCPYHFFYTNINL